MTQDLKHILEWLSKCAHIVEVTKNAKSWDQRTEEILNEVSNIPEELDPDNMIAAIVPFSAGLYSSLEVTSALNEDTKETERICNEVSENMQQALDTGQVELETMLETLAVDLLNQWILPWTVRGISIDIALDKGKGGQNG